MIARRYKPIDFVFGHGIVDNILNNFTAKTEFPEERHGREYLFGRNYQFLGPFTRYKERIERSDMGINALDRAAKEHDGIYYNEQSEYAKDNDKQKHLNNIWKADDIFIRKAKAQHDDPIMCNIIAKMIQAKEYGEKHHLIDTKKFSGMGKKDPAKRLRDLAKKANRQALKQNKPLKGGKMIHHVDLEKEQKGGIAPLAIGVISALAGTALGKIWDMIRGKGIKVPFKYYKKGKQGKELYVRRLLSAYNKMNKN